MIYTNYYRISDSNTCHSYVHAEAHERHEDAVRDIIDTDSTFVGLAFRGRTIEYIGSHLSNFSLGEPRFINLMGLAEKEAGISRSEFYQ